ncbi:MAG: DNA double-strand break repair nuclease NurA, partial [Archaeoglobaceae archaeon]
LIDGSLRGAFVRPAAYVDDPSKLYEAYELENLVPDFIEVLEEHLEILGKDLAEGRAKRNYLLTREKIFMEMEEGYRKGEKRLEDLMIFFEYIEYLHSLNRLLDKNVVFVAKSFYTHEFDQEINDSAVLQSLALKQFGFEKSGYIAFKPQLRKTLPWFVKEFRENFKNLFRDVSSAFIRFEDYGDIYLIETPQKIDEELISKLLSLEVNGYPLPLLQAHKYAKIKRGELKKAIQSLFASLKPEFAPLLRSGRDVLEG